MKYLLYTCMLFMLCACDKDKAAPVNKTLQGKWRLTATAMSIGGPIEETPADAAKPRYIEFKSDGKTLVITPAQVNGSSEYNMYGGDKVTFINNWNMSNTTYQYTIKDGELKLWPINPACIEGCYQKYTSAR